MSDLPPGYRFYPTEEELVSFYLQNKLENKRTSEIERAIPVVDIYNHDPWQLQEKSKEMCSKEAEPWFFFSRIQEREAQGGRTNRTAPSGYWKATGTPGPVFSSQNRVIGEKKTLVFYKGKAPTGTKTEWKMNEYKAVDHQVSENLAAENFSANTGPKLRHEFSLCRIYVKSGCLRSFDRRPLIEESSETIQRFNLQKRKGESNSEVPIKDFEEKKLKMDGACSSEDGNPSKAPSDEAMDLNPSKAPSDEAMDLEPIGDLENLWEFTN